MTLFIGGCFCRAIRYEANVEPAAAGACHCRDCQYVSGGAPAYVIIVPKAGVAVTQGSPRVYWGRSALDNRVGRHFCADCGTPLFGETEANPALLAIKVGSLDDPSLFKPAANVWVSAAQPWHHIDQALPWFTKGPLHFDQRG